MSNSTSFDSSVDAIASIGNTTNCSPGSLLAATESSGGMNLAGAIMQVQSSLEQSLEAILSASNGNGGSNSNNNSSNTTSPTPPSGATLP